MSNREDGYTLIELVVVFAVLALVSTLGLSLVSYDQSKESTIILVQKIDALFLEARTQAIALRGSKAVEMKIGNRFELIHGGETVYSELLQDKKIVIASGRFGSSSPNLSKFTFFQNGTSTGGRITISDPNILAVVELNWLTGLTNVSYRKLSGGVPQ